MIILCDMAQPAELHQWQVYIGTYLSWTSCDVWGIAFGGLNKYWTPSNLYSLNDIVVVDRTDPHGQIFHIDHTPQCPHPNWQGRARITHVTSKKNTHTRAHILWTLNMYNTLKSAELAQQYLNWNTTTSLCKKLSYLSSKHTAQRATCTSTFSCWTVSCRDKGIAR